MPLTSKESLLTHQAEGEYKEMDREGRDLVEQIFEHRPAGIFHGLGKNRKAVTKYVTHSGQDEAYQGQKDELFHRQKKLPS